MESVLNDRIASIREQIARAAERSGRDPSDIRLVAVSKTHPASTLREAIGFGLNIFGENKVQEAESKIVELGRDAAEWHLIGHLQSNKARKAVQLFDVIQSVDSLELAQRLERICGEEGRTELRVLIQVDLSGEATKSGTDVAKLDELVLFISSCKHLRLQGFMLLPPYSDDPEKTRQYFRKLRDIRDQLLPGGELSMGMSHDFEVAIEEGATVVRVGTALFGDRNYVHR
ncbi:MAG TPA: YggS family pyridoxal phosphate-dependent enzyme [Pyrinomonadaceae bacterium]|nr:YggS family pyridoxal phosphate-dependent enzyme [Pyrinomonadaceae bacterium]